MTQCVPMRRRGTLVLLFLFAGLGTAAHAARSLKSPIAFEKLPAVYQKSARTERPETCVAVFDTGVDMNHRQFADSLFTNSGETAENVARGIDGDSNGYKGDLHGWDFVDNDPFPFDEESDVLRSPILRYFTNEDPDKLSDNEREWLRYEMFLSPIFDFFFGHEAVGHGTHVAGITQKTSITRCVLPIRTNGDWDLVAEAVDYVAGLGVRVVNLSMGQFEGKMSSSDRKSADNLRKAMQRHPELFFVLISHNQGLNLHESESEMFPANVAIPNKIVVGAVDSKGELAPFTNVGECYVDVFAPGVDVSSAAVGGGELRMSGTSMAAPYIAGIAARVLTEYPRSNEREIFERIMKYSKTRHLEYKATANSKKNFTFQAQVIL